jgi:hypothetical protein
MPAKDDASSLQIVKLIIDCLTPILIIIIGFYLNKRLKKVEDIQWRNQKLIEKRLDIYDHLAPLFNDLLCYYTYVGNWKERTPNEIVNLKRLVDKQIYLASPLFCKDFLTKCLFFINLCYESYSGMGEDAKLRTDFKLRKPASLVKWNNDWDTNFSVNESSPIAQIRLAYISIMEIFSEEIGLTFKKHEKLK